MGRQALPQWVADRAEMSHSKVNVLLAFRRTPQLLPGGRSWTFPSAVMPSAARSPNPPRADAIAKG